MKKSLMKKSCMISLIVILALGVLSIKSYAAGTFSVSPTATTINVGETTKVTISANNCGGRFTIASSDANIASVSASEKWIENSSDTITITAKKAGTATITITAEDVSESSGNVEVKGSKKVTVTVKGTEKPGEKPNEKPAEPSFTAVNQTVYAKNETNIRESYSTTSKSFGMLEVGESIVRIGVGDNGWSKVTYNGKTAYVYSSNLTTTKPEQKKSTDKALKSLKIAEGALEPEFNPETTKYSVTISNNVEQAKIEALANSEKATVSITGNEKLIMGSNMVKITVTAEDGTTRIYNVQVIKTNQNPIQLTKLEIPGVTLSPAFSPNIYQYTIELEPNSSVTDFAIQTEANLKDATVEIIGNSNFKEGENVITILVTSSDKSEKSSYQIIVNKLAATSTNALSGENKKTNIALIAIGVLVLSGITIVIVTVVRKRGLQAHFEDEKDPYRPSFDDDLNTEAEAKNEDFTGVYKNQIMDDDEMENVNKVNSIDKIESIADDIETQDDGHISKDDEDYIPDMKQEKNIDNTVEMTRRYSTNYDYTLEQYKKPKNGGTGKGKHF